MTSSLIRRKRMFVSGQLVELWEDPEVAFGCARADLQRYVDRDEWVLLFNAMMLNAPDTELERGS